MGAVFIVEGDSDSRQIENAFEGFEEKDEFVTLVTDGTKVNWEIRDKIDMYLEDGYEVFILSDWDDGGDKLAEMVWYHYPWMERIEVDDKKCSYYSGRRYKQGVEYAPFKYLRDTLLPYIKVSSGNLVSN